VILLAGPAATAHSVSGESVHAEDAERAAAALTEEGISVLVLDADLPGAADLFERLRTGELGRPDRPVVLLGEGAFPLRSYDERLPKPVTGSALDTAVERAETVLDYRDTVETLYERCRERAAAGTADPLAEPETLAAARDAADRALAALDDPTAVADLLDE
jgi:hypothetical protein